MATLQKFRFVYTDSVEKKLRMFAKEHIDEERKEFKKSWEIFCEQEKDMLEKERLRIESEGYKKDVYEKMFHTIKYYYVKRTKRPFPKKEPVEKQYIKLDNALLEDIDTFMENNLITETNNLQFLKPQESWLRYLEQLTNVENLDLERLKKTYKTRYHKMKMRKYAKISDENKIEDISIVIEHHTENNMEETKENCVDTEVIEQSKEPKEIHVAADTTDDEKHKTNVTDNHNNTQSKMEKKNTKCVEKVKNDQEKREKYLQRRKNYYHNVIKPRKEQKKASKQG